VGLDYREEFSLMATLLLFFILIGGTGPATVQPDAGYHPIGPHEIVR
jgi:hypothetical protein